MTSLAQLPCGARAQVAGLPGHHGLARRLIALGLTPGAEVRVLQNRGRGPLIVEAHGARLAIGRKQADRVSVDLRAVPDGLAAAHSCPISGCEDIADECPYVPEVESADADVAVATVTAGGGGQ